METKILIPTETYAEKTKQVLERARIRWVMQRITAKEGCSFRFSVTAPAGTVTALLESARIPYRIG